MKPRRLAGTSPRVETGPVKFGSDWPGAFIRGDDCAVFVPSLRRALDALPFSPDGDLTRADLAGLIEILESADASTQPLEEMLAKGRQWIADNPTEAWERVKRFLDEPPEAIDGPETGLSRPGPTVPNKDEPRPRRRVGGDEGAETE